MKPKILCVDDEDSILSALERLMRPHFEVLTASSPEAALELAAKNPDCAIILSDFRMKPMNGVELLKQIRKISPQSSRAILSGQMDLAQVSDAINSGDIHKFFLKPWENDYLLLQLREAVQMHRTLVEKAHFEKLSITDPITQLTNHRHFQDQLRQKIEIARVNQNSLALAIYDVDHFKSFNDRFGHPEGDRLLHSVAQRLYDLNLGKGLVSRYGGEEFTVILDLGADTDEACKAALKQCEKVIANFEETPFAGLTSSPTFVTLSAGLACFPKHAGDANTLIEAADRALYQAKRQGRNQVSVASTRQASTKRS